MTDRELLELSAKAAGMGSGMRWYGMLGGFFRDEPDQDGISGPWNPLTDDGDALRLLVKLHMDLNFIYDGCDDQYDTVMVHTHGAKCDAEEGIGFYIRGGQIDEDAATRRAIVRAAAAIGEAMP